ncbi:Disease resistance protein [Corchorus capsularis]|uniref:Disease resistance protein n=1 Tax=Corchorus capsularis TaxID=210143 RepID=A0A1R3FYZ4_COCAP|nr:Disease resistance protein [Corchorus capsularis]
MLFKAAYDDVKTLLHEGLTETRLICDLKREIQQLRGSCISFLTTAIYCIDLEGSICISSELRKDVYLQSLKEVLDEAKELVSDYDDEKSKRQNLKGSSIGRKVTYYFSSNPAIYVRIARRISAFKKKFDLVHKDIDQFRLQMGKSRVIMDLETTPYVDSLPVIGRAEDVEKIVRVLMHSTEVDGITDLPVLPIVGTGGLGKTTVAQLVFNDVRVINHFDLRLWVYVGKYNISILHRSMMRHFIEVLKEPAPPNHLCWNWESWDFGTSFLFLEKWLEGKRLFLVLDDVWQFEEKMFEFDEKKNWFKDLLTRETNGSRIIVTTRRDDVAKSIGTIPQYDLEPLSIEDSLSLFFKTMGKEPEASPNLGVIGRNMSAVLLSRKREWLDVSNTEIWNIEEFQSELWDACGVLGSTSNDKDKDGAQNKCLHGFWQDARELLHNNTGSIRTLIFVETDEISLIESVTDQCKDLRVLIWRDSSLKVLPSGIGGLENLKYLDLTGNRDLTEIPNDICKLPLLQTLILEGCEKVEKLPTDIRNLSALNMLSITTKQGFLPENGVGCLTRLRYLAIIGRPNLKYLPQLHLLTSLRTFIIRDCNSLTALPRSMKYLIALETLVIANCEKLRLNRKNKVNKEEDDYPAHLMTDSGFSLHRLWIVSLPELSDLPEEFVRKSAKTLHHLHIQDCQKLKAIPMWIQDLTSLENLGIVNCQSLSYPPGISNSSVLKKAKIEDCPHLTQENVASQSPSSSVEVIM